MKLPRMRTIPATHKLLKEIDPQTEVSQHFIRQLVLQGLVKYCMTGNKYLINFDNLMDYFENPDRDSGLVEDNSEFGKIRAVK